uniref:Kazal-like domain-containing protein n=1 Tax=Timema monikensis TaxID=170555 RepID=A0A7R9E5H1_9NEOP|nr:unnamed protein product [Timema monikensis]
MLTVIAPLCQVASCESVNCRDRQSCLVDLSSGAPRCVTCSYRCPRPSGGMRREMGGPICGTNNRTYHSWCHMLKDACATGYVIETKHSGSCGLGGVKPTIVNTVLNDSTNINRYS